MKSKLHKIISYLAIPSIIATPIILSACNNQVNNTQEKIENNNDKPTKNEETQSETKNTIKFSTNQSFSFGFKDDVGVKANKKPQPIFLENKPELNLDEQNRLEDLFYSWYNYYQKTFAKALYLYYIYDYALFNLYEMDYSNVVSEFVIHYDSSTKKFNLDYEIKIKVDGINNLDVITPTTFYTPINKYELDFNNNSQPPLISPNFGEFNLNYIKNKNKAEELKVYFTTADNIKNYAENKIKMRIAYRDLDVYQTNVKYSNAPEVYQGYTALNGKLYRWFNKSVIKKNNDENISFMIYDTDQFNADQDFEMINLNQQELDQIFLIKRYQVKEPEKSELKYTNIYSVQLEEFEFDLQNYFINTFISNKQKIVQTNQNQNNRQIIRTKLEIIKQKVLATKQLGLASNRYAIYSMFNYFDLTLEPDNKPSGSKHCHADGYCH